jgi:hypothetical protein
MRKLGPGCTIGLQLHVTLKHTEGMANMISQEFLGMDDTG